jgi:hypothetical protein
MSKRNLETELAQAREKLAALQDKLPEYHGDVDTAEGDVARLKADNAPLAKQRAARVAAMASRDMKLEFEADIAAARGHVSELEDAAHEERLIGQMSAAAEDAKKHRLKMDAAFAAAEDALHKAADLIWESWEAEAEARKAFTEAGELFVPGFQSKSDPPWAGRQHDEIEPFRARVNGLMDELQNRGVPLDYATDGETGRYNCLDRYEKHPLPHDPVALAIWEALKRIKGPDARRFERFVPKPKGTVALPPHLR